MSNYRTYNRRGSSTKSTGPRANKYPGPCRYCGVEVPAGAGLLERGDDGWVVKHAPARRVGSPVSGRWAGGCCS